MTSAEKWDALPEMIGIKEYQQITGLSRKAAIHVFNMKSFPALDRTGAKGQGRYIAPTAAVRAWMEDFTRGTK